MEEKRGLILNEQKLEMEAEAGAQFQQCWQIVGKNEGREAAVRRNVAEMASATVPQEKVKNQGRGKS